MTRRGGTGLRSSPSAIIEVQTELSGFQTVVHTGIRLSAGADVVVYFKMPIGQISEPLTVTAEVAWRIADEEGRRLRERPGHDRRRLVADAVDDAGLKQASRRERLHVRRD